jgi:NAD(P)-dependent dehydrogenase (short-subunit alcohol dehydrogenase family)
MKNYIIIGGSKGIGRSIIKDLLMEGHTVYNFSRTDDDLPASVHHTTFDASVDELDVTTLPDVIHGLVYCPGSILLKPFRTLKASAFEDDFRLSVLGAVKAIQACLPKFSKGDDKASIVMFSTVAVSLGMPFHASVGVTKGAIEGLVKSLAAELAPNVRVNAVAPSLTDTPLAAALLSTPEKQQRSADMHPLKRYGKSEDIANAVIFLLSDKSSWITGQVLAVDGGLSSVKS